MSLTDSGTFLRIPPPTHSIVSPRGVQGSSPSPSTALATHPSVRKWGGDGGRPAASLSVRASPPSRTASSIRRGPSRAGGVVCPDPLCRAPPCRDVSRKPFRVEVNYPANGQPKYYLVRDVKVGTARTKVRKYLGTHPPSAGELNRFRRELGPKLELAAVERKARYSAGSFKSEILDEKAVYSLERVRAIYRAVIDLMTLSETAAYEREFEISYIHGTTAIEGNTLSLAQARDLLTNDIPPARKSLREINEVQNFKRVLRYRNAYHGRVTLDFVRNLHGLIMDNIDLESAGQFRRRDDIGIEGCPIPVTPSRDIVGHLTQIIHQYYGRIDAGYHPFEEAILFHYRFEMTHPFTDGNGRVGRELLNFMLARARYPRLLFLGRDRPKYIATLKLGNAGHYGPMVLDFLGILLDQRAATLEKRLKEVSSTRPKGTGQLRLTQFLDTGGPTGEARAISPPSQGGPKE